MAIEVSQGLMEVAAAGGTIVVPFAVIQAAAARPSLGVDASQADVLAAVSATNQTRVSQLMLLVAARGRINDPKIRAWTCTLDGHDYYVLRLGNIETLIYDTYSQEWYNWGSGTADLWRAYHGTNWIGGNSLSREYGSNIVVGDDGNGSIYFLKPEGVDDDDPHAGPDVPRPFRRELTAMAIVPGSYESFPCYGLELFGSIGETDDERGVTLQLSDDRGMSYETVDTITVAPNDIGARLDWRSLGSMEAPGRLFKII